MNEDATTFGFQGGLPVRRFKAILGKGIQGKIDGEMFHLGSTWFSEIIGNIVQTGKTTSILFKQDKALITVLFEDALAKGYRYNSTHQYNGNFQHHAFWGQTNSC